MHVEADRLHKLSEHLLHYSGSHFSKIINYVVTLEMMTWASEISAHKFSNLAQRTWLVYFHAQQEGFPLKTCCKFASAAVPWFIR